MNGTRTTERRKQDRRSDMENDRTEVRHGWHLDKRVPIATLVTIAMLAAGGVWHIGEIRAEQRNAATERQYMIQQFNSQIQAINERITRENQQHIATNVRIEDRLNRIDSNIIKLIEGRRKERE